MFGRVTQAVRGAPALAISRVTGFALRAAAAVVGIAAQGAVDELGAPHECKRAVAMMAATGNGKKRTKTNLTGHSTNSYMNT